MELINGRGLETKPAVESLSLFVFGMHQYGSATYEVSSLGASQQCVFQQSRA